MCNLHVVVAPDPCRPDFPIDYPEAAPEQIAWEHAAPGDQPPGARRAALAAPAEFGSPPPAPLILEVRLTKTGLGRSS
jgi:hypothetical protein